MAKKEFNVDLDIKGKVSATTVPNSTGSIVTWNTTSKVFGFRTNAQIISDLNLSSSFVPYTGATANVNLGARSITSTGGFIGNASTATTLATARTINGTSFNGSANITTASWGTARNITIGNTTKSVNGSGNVSWSLAEIGAASSTSLSNYVPYTGATQTVNLGNQKLWNVSSLGLTNDSMTYPNATNSNAEAWNQDSKNYFSISSGNNMLAIIGESTFNKRTFGIQVGHKYSAYANSTGVLELQPLHGDVRIGSLSGSGTRMVVVTPTGIVSSQALPVIPTIDNLVPYTGANQPIDLNTQKITHNGIVSNVNSTTSPWLSQDTPLLPNNKVAYLIIDGFTASTPRQLYIEVESISGNGEHKRLVKGFNVHFTKTNTLEKKDSRYLEVTGSDRDNRYSIGEVEKHSNTALKIPLIWIASYAISANKISVKAHTGSISNLTFSIEYDATSTLTTENPYLYRNVSEKWVNNQLSGYVPTSRTLTAGNGLSGGGNLTANRTFTLGTPSAITLSSTNSVAASSHTHAFTPGGTTAQYIRGDGSLATYVNTTYSAGNGLTLSGTVFSITKATATGSGNAVSDYNVTSTGIQLVKGITAMETSHVANGITSTLITNWNTAFTNNHTHSNKSNLDTINQNLGKTSDVSFGSINSNNITVLGSTFNMLELKRSGSTGSSVLFSNSTNGNLGKVGFGQNGDLYITKGASSDSSADLLMISGSTGLPRFSGLSGSGTRVVSIGTDGTLAPITPTIDYILGAGNSTSKNIKFIGEGSIISEANGTKLNMLAHQKFINGTSTGILTIKHATVASATMFDVVIKVYGYNSKYMGEYRIAFYQNSATSIHASTGICGYITGTDNLPSKVVKVGLDADGKISIMIGDATTSWNSNLSYTLERVETKYSGWNNASWDNGWTSEIVTDITGYTNIVTIPMTDIANNYELPIASASVLGGVKVGTNLSINASGVLSATDTNTTYSAGNGLTLSGTAFSLPVTQSGSGNVVSAVAQSVNGITVTKGNSVPLQASTGGDINSIRVLDTRSTNPAPSTDLKNGTWFDFKTTSAIGLTISGVGTYASVMTMVPYADVAGNNNTAFRLAHSNNGLYFQRALTSKTGGWDNWKSVVDGGIDNIVGGNNPFGEVNWRMQINSSNQATLTDVFVHYNSSFVIGSNSNNFEAITLKTVFGSLDFDDEGLNYRPNSQYHSFGILANINAYYDIELHGKLNNLKINGRSSLGSPADALIGNKLSNYVFGDVSNKNALGTFRVENNITKDGGNHVFARYGASILAQTGDTMFTLSANPNTPEIFVSAGNTTNNVLWNKKLAFSVNEFPLYAQAFYENSLRELKENIKPFNKSGIELINSLDIVTFDRKDSEVKNKIGIIADDSIEEVLSTKKDAVDLYNTVFIQAKAIQELSDKVDKLTELVNKLTEQ